MLMQVPQKAQQRSTLEDFRLAMRQLASGVALVTCAHKGVWRGLTATSVTSLSLDPPSLLVCVNRQSSFHSLIHVGMHFGVNLLNHQHAELSNEFGGSMDTLKRFESGAWSSNAAGVPLLKDALAAIDCIVDKQVDYGSHSIIIGRVSEVTTGAAEAPLIYCNGGYH